MNKRYREDRAKAVKWIRSRATGPDWWTWMALTEHNNDETNPKLEDGTARAIFRELEYLGLLKPFDVPATDKEGRALKFPAYQLVTANEGAWDRLEAPPGLRHRVWELLNRPLPVAIISGIVGGVIGWLLAKVAS